MLWSNILLHGISNRIPLLGTALDQWHSPLLYYMRKRRRKKTPLSLEISSAQTEPNGIKSAHLSRSLLNYSHILVQIVCESKNGSLPLGWGDGCSATHRCAALEWDVLFCRTCHLHRGVTHFNKVTRHVDFGFVLTCFVLICEWVSVSVRPHTAVSLSFLSHAVRLHTFKILMMFHCYFDFLNSVFIRRSLICIKKINCKSNPTLNLLIIEFWSFF